MQSGMIPRVPDIWEQLHSVFEGSSERNPEIHFLNVGEDEIASCVLYLLRISRDFVSRFVIPGTEVAVDMTSPHAAVDALVQGTVTGAFWVGLSGLPPVTVYVDEPHMFSVSYMRGEWTALTVLGLFDLLHRLTVLAPSAEVYPDAFSFSDDEQMRFTAILQQYQNALS